MADEPIQSEYQKTMNGLAAGIDTIFNGKDCPKDKKKTGFVLLVYPLGETPDNRMNYISNSDRADVLASMREFIARNEGRYHETRKAD